MGEKEIRCAYGIDIDAVVGRVLAHYGLGVRDWDGGAYLLSDKKGRVEVVRDLGALRPDAQPSRPRPDGGALRRRSLRRRPPAARGNAD